jgi:predicted glycosyl hydrolase (DUF1957 family)
VEGDDRLRSGEALMSAESRLNWKEMAIAGSCESSGRRDSMKYITIFHANLNYAYLTEDRYEFVIRRAYEMTLDTMQTRFPEVKFVFEASGYTLEQIAQKAPDVLEKLKVAIARGQCEFMGSPYAHPMLPNFPREDGIWSIRFSNETYARLLDSRPRSFWNPECGWRSYIPEQVLETGYRNMIGDFEAYSLPADRIETPHLKSMPKNSFRANFLQF